MLKNRISLNSTKIILKLLNDSVLVLASFLFLSIVLETLLPGVISGRRGFEYIIISLVLNLMVIGYFSRKLGVEFKDKENKKATYWLLSVCTLIIIGSLVKFGFILMFPIILLSVIVFYFLYLSFFKTL